MSWRLQVRHQTGYRYQLPVLASYNEARMTPLTDPRQTTISADIHIEPYAPVQRYWDYWGTQVAAFDLHHPHEELLITSTATVDCDPPAPPVNSAGWAQLGEPEVSEDFVELLAPTSYVPVDEELAALARDLAGRAAPVEAAQAVCGWVHEELAYQPGITGVHTSAVEAWRAGRGVCQDYAHLGLVLLRSLGLPARYVSGYLHPAGDADVGVSVGGESHAWLDVWTGDWWGWDVTNGTAVGERHVTVARGRDYADVPPLRGIYSGGGSSELVVDVTVTRLR